MNSGLVTTGISSTSPLISSVTIHMDSPVFATSFLNCYERDELRQDLDNYPKWLEDDNSDDLIFEDALYGVI